MGAEKNLGGGRAILQERRKKLEQLRQGGIPAFPNDFRPERRIAEVLRDFADHKRDDLEGQEGNEYSVSVAGRITARRGNFLVLHSDGADLQAYLERGVLTPEIEAQVDGWDLGDIVGIRGVMRRSRKGDLYLAIRSELQPPVLLVKGLRPLPEKYHGLQDEELRYRQRYLDWLTSGTARGVARLRGAVLGALRSTLLARGFTEVETPMLHSIPGGAAALPFRTRHNALNLDMYLRIAPELYLKRFLVGGFERVFELGRCFRNEGVSSRHNPEFTMLEFYQAYAGYKDFMELIENMLGDIAEKLPEETGTLRCDWKYSEKEDAPGGKETKTLDFSVPFARVDMATALEEHNPSLAGRLTDEALLRQVAKEQGIRAEESDTVPRLQLKIFEKTVEPNLFQPTFIQHYPTSVSPLARARDDDPDTAERFELFIGGLEVANGFSELNDPEEQLRRFQAQAKERAGGDEEAMRQDQDFIEALEHGMPPAAGAGIGIDRLVMLLSGAPSIREVIAFPLLRSERD